MKQCGKVLPTHANHGRCGLLADFIWKTPGRPAFCSISFTSLSSNAASLPSHTSAGWMLNHYHPAAGLST